MIAGYGQNRMRDHGGAMIVIGLLMPRAFMLQLQIWMQFMVLVLLIKLLVSVILVIIIFVVIGVHEGSVCFRIPTLRPCHGRLNN